MNTPDNETVEAGHEPAQQDVELVSRAGFAFLMRCVLVALVCLVLGLWGVWDYVEVIPKQIRYFARAEVSRAYMKFAEPVVNGSGSIDEQSRHEFIATVIDDLKIESDPAIDSEVAGLQAAVESGGTDALDRLNTSLVQSIVPHTANVAAKRLGIDLAKIPDVAGSDNRARWMAQMAVMVAGARSPVTGTRDSSQALKMGMIEAQRTLGLYGEVEPPSSYDLPIQWLFILCLPFAPWYIFALVRAKSRVYRLGSDGTLYLPGETWAPTDLADIDMSRWMKTSKAWVVHTDGHRVVMDDYVYKDMFKIVGAVAEAKYPEKWTYLAKLVKTDA